MSIVPLYSAPLCFIIILFRWWLVYSSSHLSFSLYFVAPPYSSWQLVLVVLLVGPLLGPLFPLAPPRLILPLPVVRLPPTLLRLLCLLVPLAELLPVFILSELLIMYCQDYFCCCWHSILFLSHVIRHCWWVHRRFIPSIVPRHVHPLIWRWDLWSRCQPHCQDCCEDPW